MHQEQATFNSAPRTIESPNVDEPRTRGVARELIDKFVKDKSRKIPICR